MCPPLTDARHVLRDKIQTWIGSLQFENKHSMAIFLFEDWTCQPKYSLLTNPTSLNTLFKQLARKRERDFKHVWKSQGAGQNRIIWNVNFILLRGFSFPPALRSSNKDQYVITKILGCFKLQHSTFHCICSSGAMALTQTQMQCKHFSHSGIFAMTTSDISQRMRIRLEYLNSAIPKYYGPFTPRSTFILQQGLSLSHTEIHKCDDQITNIYPILLFHLRDE